MWARTRVDDAHDSVDKEHCDKEHIQYNRHKKRRERERERERDGRTTGHASVELMRSIKVQGGGSVGVKKFPQCECVRATAYLGGSN